MSLRNRRILSMKKEEKTVEAKPLHLEDKNLIEPIVIIEPEEMEDNRVICINTETIYEDYKDASEKTGVNMGAIKRCCDGSTKSAGKDEEGNKLVWKYVRDI